MTGPVEREVKSNRAWREECESLRQQLAECQAQVKAAKREALLEAAEIADDMDWSDGVIGSHFRNMAKELE